MSEEEEASISPSTQDYYIDDIDSDSEEEKDLPKIKIFGNRTRFVLLFLILLCTTSIRSNILSYEMAVICMAPIKNGTAKQNADRYQYNNDQATWLAAIVPIGALLNNVPSVTIANRRGIRGLFTVLGFISTLATILLPTAIKAGFPYVMVLRFFQGIAFSGNFPVIGVFCDKWTFYKQTGLFVSVLVAYLQLAPVVTNTISGSLCAWSWESIFYVHSIASFSFFTVYYFFYRNDPAHHRFVGAAELNKIQRTKIQNIGKRALQQIPYKDILKTPAVWAIWLGATGYYTAVNLLLIYSPTYYAKCFISDRWETYSEQNKFRAFNSIAFTGSAVFFVALGFTGGDNPEINVTLMSFVAAILGIATGGFFKAAPILSRQYSLFVTGNIALTMTFTNIVIPFIVAPIAPHKTLKEWRIVFLGAAGVLILSNILFVVFVSGEAAEWTQEKYVRKFTRKFTDREREKRKAAIRRAATERLQAGLQPKLPAKILAKRRSISITVIEDLQCRDPTGLQRLRAREFLGLENSSLEKDKY